jgi:hypothetical protein
MIRIWIACLVALGGVGSARAQATPEPEPEPVSVPEPEPESDASEDPFEIRGEVFAEYSNSRVAAQRQSAFELTRGEIGMQRLGNHDFGGELRLESIRSAGPNSFSGIDEDSLVVRIKRAWAFGRHRFGDLAIEGQVGLVPTLWITAIEPEYAMRFLVPTVVERLLIYDTSDLGAVASVDYAQRIRLSVAVLNGEGRNQIEQNRGKSTQALLSATPLQADVDGAPLRVRLHLGGQEGSQGAGSARNHRISAGLSLAHPRLALGVEVHQVYGYEEVSARRSRALSLWLRGSWRFMNGVLRYDDYRDDLSRDMTGSRFLMAGVFAERRRPLLWLRLGLMGRFERAENNATPLPGLAFAASSNAGLVVLAANFGGGPSLW